MAVARKSAKPPQAARGRVIANILLALIALCGLADALYLTVMHLTGDDAVCGSSAGCSIVLGSVYASVGPIPTASFGVLAYFVVFSAAICAAFGYRRAWSVLVVAVAGMFLVTLGLIALQAFVLHAFCPFCLFSAALTFLLAGIVVAVWPA
ncbi:MAG TPA: vitamin K epoxide reductase family protein [Chthoniobacterales bacterium]|jgi:uncharacterized membrane protein